MRFVIGLKVRNIWHSFCSGNLYQKSSREVSTRVFPRLVYFNSFFRVFLAPKKNCVEKNQPGAVEDRSQVSLGAGE